MPGRNSGCILVRNTAYLLSSCTIICIHGNSTPKRLLHCSRVAGSCLPLGPRGSCVTFTRSEGGAALPGEAAKDGARELGQQWGHTHAHLSPPLPQVCWRGWDRCCGGMTARTGVIGERQSLPCRLIFEPGSATHPALGGGRALKVF